MKKAVLFVFVVAVTLAIVPTTRDEIHWLWSSRQDDTASYESYVKTWPHGRHAAEAMRLYDERSWNDAVATNTIRGFERYLQIPAEGRHFGEARDNIESLRINYAMYSAALGSGTEGA
jgi:hypothetical protein